MPCMCGDSECPSCGLAQGTLSPAISPDAMLAEVRAFVERIQAGDKLTLEETGELADAVEALDRWLTDGGYPPTAWEREPV